MSAVAELSGVSRRFGDLYALRDVTLEFAAGKTTAVVGESGSGKTTLLQLINALERPDAGRVRVFGDPVPRDRVERFRRRIGYAVQGSGLFPHMTSRDNVVLLARLEAWTAQAVEQRYRQLLEQMELPDSVSHRYPGQISGGQRQRLGLCRALMLKPGLLLLDEPFSTVDPITRVGIYDVFQQVQRQEGVSTLLVTHDMREAVRLAEHLVVLRGGRVLQSGTTESVLNDPGDPYVRQLVETQL